MNEEIKVFGLFGYPLKHSLSAPMQNAALRKLKIPGIYFAFERNRKTFRRLIRSRKRMILDGFNLTVPHKEEIIPYLDSMDPVAKKVGAVNTVKRIGNRWIGYNTDVYGFQQGLREARFKPRGKSAVLLGSGGAARAVMAALGGSGIRRVSIWNRTAGKRNSLIRDFRRKYSRTQFTEIQGRADLRNALCDANLLVNATSVGLKKSDPTLVSRSTFPKRPILVYDLIYGRKKTKLVSLARRLGHRTVEGETMLLHQGAKALEIWTNRKAPIGVMRKALKHALMGQ